MNNVVKLPPAAMKLKRLVDGMPEALRDVYVDVRNMLTAEASSEVMARYDVGAVLKSLKDAGKYGETPVPQLAEALGIPENNLWTYIRMATVWTKPQIKSLLQQRTSKNLPLTYSHLGVLSGLEDAKLRDKLQKACFVEALTVREVVAAAQAALGAKRSKGHRKPLAPKSPAAGLSQFSKLAATLINRQDVYEQSVILRIEEMEPEEASDALRKAVSEAEELAEGLATFANTLRQRLHAAASSLSKGKEARTRSEHKNPRERASAILRARKASKLAVVTA